MSKYILTELHCHTFHSDGQQTLLQLATQAKEIGLDAFALTDHNTHSGHYEIEEAYKKTGVKIIKGIEYTTFYGHIVTIGNPVVMPFRHFYKSDITEVVKTLGGSDRVVGIAHPFAVGNPICTGCHFNYDKENPYFDYLEIWSGEFSTNNNIVTELAMHLWTKLLNEGRTICGVLGKDWHTQDRVDQPIASTAILVSDDVTQQNIDMEIVEAIKNRRVCLTLYKVPSLEVISGNFKYCVGDIISVKPKQEIMINMSLINKMLPNNNGRFKDLSFAIYSNLGVLYEENIEDEKKTYTYVTNIENITWIRLQVFGYWNDKKILISVTNPIFFKH